MRVGILLIGDELLSGKRQDKHLAQTITALTKRNMELSWCRLMGDSPDLITNTLVETFAGDDLVISFGGIGATPDDRTRQCVAQAAGVPLVLHTEGAAILRSKFGDTISPQRLQMVEFPEGAELIPNPYNQVPGFRLKHHHFLPGFPQMSWPMMDWLLDTHYNHLQQAPTVVEFLFKVYGVPESEMVPVMEALSEHFPTVKISSLPHIESPRAYIEFGIRGATEIAGQASDWFRGVLVEKQLEWVDEGCLGT